MMKPRFSVFSGHLTSLRFGPKRLKSLGFLKKTSAGSTGQVRGRSIQTKTHPLEKPSLLVVGIYTWLPLLLHEYKVNLITRPCRLKASVLFLPRAGIRMLDAHSSTCSANCPTG